METFSSTYRLELHTGPQSFAGNQLRSNWDRALERSRFDSLFLSHGWLSACLETYGYGEHIFVPTVWRGTELVASALLHSQNGIVQFVGIEQSDYLDFILSKDLDSAAACYVTGLMLSAVADATPGFRHFDLRMIRKDSGLADLLNGIDGLFPLETQVIVAPSMDMTTAPEALKKKSLVRHERKLLKMGNLTADTFRRARDIDPRLEEFFEQHIRRWKDTPYPSLFLNPKDCDFYRAVVRNLDNTGMLRFTELRLDGRLIAAHFGFSKSGVFTWYKPTFEPSLSKFSPGEVLIKRLIEAAQTEGCEEFDFTIGNEMFKRRFATDFRRVVRVIVTTSFLKTRIFRAYRDGRRMLSNVKSALMRKKN